MEKMKRSMLIISVLMMEVICGEDSFLAWRNNYDTYGHRIDLGSNSIAVVAQNELGRFELYDEVFLPNDPGGWPSFNIPYNQSDDFIQNLAFFSDISYTFVYLGQNSNRTSQFLVIVHVDFVTNPELNRQEFASASNTNDYYVYSLGIDPQGNFAYVFGNNYSYIYDLQTYNFTTIPSDTFARCLQPVDVVIIDADYALVVGYSCGLTSSVSFFRSISLFSLQNSAGLIQLIVNQTILASVPEINLDRVSYSLLNDLSLAVNANGQVIVGVPMYNIIVFYTALNGNLTSDEKNISWSAGSAFGKSVAWLNNQTFAVLVYSVASVPWSSSQIFVFDISSDWPLYSFPNNQQPIGGVSVSSPLFLRLRSSLTGQLLVLLDSGEVLALPLTPAGIHSKCIVDSSIHSAPFHTCTFTECSSGTYKQSTSIGPCYLCPPRTKNPKRSNITDVECEGCANDSYCPLGGIDDVARQPYTESYSQAVAYPESPDSTIFDDILIGNMFSLEVSSLDCLLISPVFWTLITALLASLIVLLVGLFQIVPSLNKHALIIHRIFKQTDLIGEGELWIGGLFSLSIIVLVSFAYAFSNAYLSLYPIERSSDARFACDRTMRNAKFSTGVRLLSIPVSEEEEPIFDLLERQSFHLSVDLLNIVPNCANLLLVQSVGANEIPLEEYLCVNSSSAVATVSLQLPVHQLTVSITISNSNAIGALRLCLTGAENLQKKFYQLRALNFCQYFGGENETLSYTPKIAISLTKVINKTLSIITGGQTEYSALFIPTIIANGISDQSRYARFGDYLRYLPAQSLITIDLSETQFYLKNTEEPIARQAEIVFHTLLFTILTLELFGLVFLLFQLSILPLVRLINRKYFPNNRVGVIPVNENILEVERRSGGREKI